MLKKFQFITQYLFYPGVLCFGVFLAFWAKQKEIPETLIVSVLMILTTVTIFIFQRHFPFSRRWKFTWLDFRVDILHAFFSMGGVPFLIQILILGSVFQLATWGSETLTISLWPNQWPILIQFILALVAGEFGSYWVHRFCHEKSFLWKIHAVHHSPERLYALSSGRNHPFNVALSYSSQVIPLILMGASKDVLYFQAVFTGLHGLLQHSNIKMNTLFLSWFFSTPHLHRYHHSREIEVSNANYGSNIILWDIIFRTWHCPKKQPSDDVGLPKGTNFPEDYLGQLVSPFKF
mgnify:CR=1 FL=1